MPRFRASATQAFEPSRIGQVLVVAPTGPRRTGPPTLVTAALCNEFSRSSQDEEFVFERNLRPTRDGVACGARYAVLGTCDAAAGSVEMGCPNSLCRLSGGVSSDDDGNGNQECLSPRWPDAVQEHASGESRRSTTASIVRCVHIAREVMLMSSQRMAVREIRAAIDIAYAGIGAPTETPIVGPDAVHH